MSARRQSINLMPGKDKRARYSAADGYDAAASSYDTWKWQKFWQRFEWPIIEEKINGHFSTCPRRILDVGVGTGTYLAKLQARCPEAILCGIDVSRNMLRLARAKLGRAARLLQCAAEQVPIEDDTIDLVLMCRVGSHLHKPNLIESVREIERVLVPGGLFIASDLHPEHDYVCTAVPTPHGRIRISTHKHRIEDWEAACGMAGLVASRPRHIFAHSIPRTQFQDLELSSEGPIAFILAATKPV